MARVESDSRAFQAAVALLAAGSSYWHGRESLTEVMDPVSASVTLFLLNVVAYWLADAYVTQARAGRRLASVHTGVCGLLTASVWINTAAAQTWSGALGRALAPTLFALFVIFRVRLALAERRAEQSDDEGLPLRLWLRHPVRAARAWLWLAHRSAPAFRAASAERDRYRDLRAAVRLAMPGPAHWAGRAVVLRELAAGRLAPADALAASGLLTRPGLRDLHRAAVVASLGGALASEHTTQAGLSNN
ncbi:MAG TPA: hypothetical protein VHJ83_07850 [Micromonosporaceae bacterium]|nr:hypothetical protein [Micromonosporaceae bacterium]